MIVSFATLQLKEVVLVLNVAERRLGIDAQAFIAMIADIEAFDNAEQMMAFLDEAAKVESDDTLILLIGTMFRALFVATGATFRRDDNDRVIWSSVTRLKLIEVEEC